jgi:hypothetical protein
LALEKAVAVGMAAAEAGWVMAAAVAAALAGLPVAAARAARRVARVESRAVAERAAAARAVARAAAATAAAARAVVARAVARESGSSVETRGWVAAKAAEARAEARVVSRAAVTWELVAIVGVRWARVVEEKERAVGVEAAEAAGWGAGDHWVACWARVAVAMARADWAVAASAVAVWAAARAAVARAAAAWARGSWAAAAARVAAARAVAARARWRVCTINQSLLGFQTGPHRTLKVHCSRKSRACRR